MLMYVAASGRDHFIFSGSSRNLLVLPNHLSFPRSNTANKNGNDLMYQNNRMGSM